MKNNPRSLTKSFFRNIYRTLPFKSAVLGLLRRSGASHWIPPRLKGYLAFEGPFTVQVEIANFSMLNGYGRAIEATIFWDGADAFETTTISWWKKLSKRSQYIFDIGANTGIFSFVAKALNPKAEIHAFEPLGRIHAILEANIQLNNLSAPPL